MARHERYTVNPGLTPSTYIVQKVDVDFEPTGQYDIAESPSGNLECTCFASNKSTCRHRDMVRLFKSHKLVGSHRWYNFDKKVWLELPKAAEEL